MAGDVVPFQMPEGMLEKYKDLFGDTNNDMTDGVADSFGVVSFKGKTWRVKYKGEEKIVKNKDGDPLPSLVCVLVKSSPQISKIYYPGAYAEGDNEAPTCFSIDGVKPDPGADNQQAPNCAACPQNIWGSKVTEQGNKTKACSDSRRVAVVPYPDLRNETFGGPLLLRIPPASLQEFKSYGEGLERMGVPYPAVITKISFDMELAYPKLKFEPLKGLTEEEVKVVLEMQGGDYIGRMLAEAPMTDESRTPAEAAAATAGPGQAEPTPPIEQAAVEAMAVVETVVEAEPVTNGTVETPPAKEKQTPKEANAAPATEVEEELTSLIGNLI